MREVQLADFDPGPAAEALFARQQFAVVVADDGDDATAMPWQPDEITTSGWLAGVEVQCDSSLSGTLVVSIVGKDLGRIHPSTVRLFRRDDEEGLFILNPFSGPGAGGRYVWGRIGAGGIYAVIGLDCDALFLRALEILAVVRDLLVGGARDLRLEVTTGIIDSLLTSPRPQLGRAGGGAGRSRLQGPSAGLSRSSLRPRCATRDPR